MKIKLFYVLLCLVTSYSFADNAQNTTVSSTQPHAGSNINSQVSDINNQIKNISQNLSDKQNKKQDIDKAIKSSQSAISKSNELLKKLRRMREVDLAKLQQLEVTIPQITTQTEAVKAQVTGTMTTIYQQIKELQNQEQSILSGNDSVNLERKRMYMISILQQQNQKYIELSNQLDNLQELSQRLQVEVDRLSKQIGDGGKAYDNLLADVDAKQKQAKLVEIEISKDKSKLSNLKKRQSELNNLMKKLAAEERKRKLAQQKASLAAAKAAKTKTANTGNNAAVVASNNSQKSVSSKYINQDAIDNSIEDNSPFMSRKLVRPYSGSVISSFGQMRDGVRNNGVLVSAPDGSSVQAVSAGNVLFSGSLPGFGQIVVIDNGNNYTSIYSGILAKVKKGTNVSAGSVIGVTGTSSNQPMGGVYFELRNLGKPVNPGKIF